MSDLTSGSVQFIRPKVIHDGILVVAREPLGVLAETAESKMASILNVEIWKIWGQTERRDKPG